MFNILGKRVDDATVLDLFAGTGALGLEAYSRNARFTVFIDNHPLALKLIRKNILHCIGDHSGDREIRVIQHDLTRNIPYKKLPQETHSGFDVIFADPPYAKDMSISVLKFINNSSLLRPNGLLIVEERHTIDLPSSLSSLERIDRRVYGEAAFFFYRSSVAP